MHKYLLFALIGLMLSGCAAYTATSGQVVLKDDSVAPEVRFSGSDRVLIQNYYKSSAPAGKSSATMPLIKSGKLPSGVRAEPLPRDLERKLSPLPSSYAREKVGLDVLIMEKKTRVIADVLYGVAN